MKKGSKKKPLRVFEDLTGPEKELMRQLAKAHWSPDELSKFFRVEKEAVNLVTKNALKYKFKKEPKGLNNIKKKLFYSEGW